MSEIISKTKTLGKQILDTLTAAYIYIAAVIVILQLVAIFAPINAWFAFVVFLANLLTFSFLKDFISEKEKKLGFLAFKASFMLFAFGLLSVFRQFLEENAKTAKSVKPIFLLLYVGTTLGFLVFYLDESKKKMFEGIFETSLLEKTGLLNKKDEMKEGDAILCTNKETKADVVIPFEDRFLHMLVLGPTGCGKTSQVLIPLINQDIKTEGYGVTVIEPKGDLAEKVYAMAKYYGKPAVYFNPTHPDCPYFNPLYGPEDEVIENMATTFKMLNPDSPQFFLDMNETVIRHSLKVLKRLKGNSATMLDLSTLIYNSQGQGKIMINNFAKKKTKTVEEAKENGEIASWFLSDYFNEKSKTYEHCSGLRSQVAKITSNVHLRRVLNPPNGENDVDFAKVIEEGKILAISTAQGDLRDLGRFLGYFIILNLQSAVFKRPGNEFTRRPHFLYIDEFQTYSNPGFADMLTQGRSYRVASHLATQNRALMAMGGGRDGNNFVELVSTNARNVVLFPGGNNKDADFYSKEFGDVTKLQVSQTVSKKKFNILYGIDKLGYPSVSTREDEVTEARFSGSDLVYKDFGEITYRIIKNKSVGTPGSGIVSWIPKELNKKLDNLVTEYNEEQLRKLNTTEQEGSNDDDSSSDDSDSKNQSQMSTTDLAAIADRVVRIERINTSGEIDEAEDENLSRIKEGLPQKSSPPELSLNPRVFKPEHMPKKGRDKEDILIDYNDSTNDDLI